MSPQLKFSSVIGLLHVAGSALSLLGCTYSIIAQVGEVLAPGYSGGELARPLSCQVALGFSAPAWPIIVNAEGVFRGVNGFEGLIARLVFNTGIVILVTFLVSHLRLLRKPKV
jgi:hypothetical protein